MKKTLSVILALCILFAFAACGSAGDDKAQGEKTLLGTWHLYSEGSTTPKASIVMNEDGTGVYTTVREARETVKNFTYTDASGVLKLAFEDGTSAEWSYTLEVDKLTIEGNTFTRPVQ